MRYCVNCAEQYDSMSGICPVCCLDQSVPEEIIDDKVDKSKKDKFIPNDIEIGYPGEIGALRLAIFIAIFTVVLLGTITIGLFLLILVANLVHLKARHLASKGSMVTVSENNFKTVFKLSKIAAFRLKLPLPDIYVTQDPNYNAYASGFYRHGFIVLNSSLVREFKPTELLFVIGHELGHMKRQHTTWLNLLEPVRTGGARFFFAPLMRIIFNVWSVKAEYTADQAGLVAGRDLGAACRALLKIAAGDGVDDNVDLSTIDEVGSENEQVLSSMAEYLGTHPFIQNRVRHLTSFALSAQYRDSWKSPPTQGDEL